MQFKSFVYSFHKNENWNNCVPGTSHMLDSFYFPTVQLAPVGTTRKLVVTLWLRTRNPHCSTEVCRRLWSSDCTTRETRKALYEYTCSSGLWFPDCTTRKFVGWFMIPHLLAEPYYSGKLVGVLKFQKSVPPLIYNSKTRRGVVLPSIVNSKTRRGVVCSIIARRKLVAELFYPLHTTRKLVGEYF